jgi:OPC-8:0 CoA ligase-1
VTFSCEKICCRVEDEETGQIPMAYVVRAAGSELSEDQVIKFVAGQV